MKSPAPSLAPAAPKPVYVSASYIAQACRLSFVELENHFRPDDWASPRDFTFTRRGMLYAEASLPRLADSLDARGQHESARLLREYITKISANPAPAAEQDRLLQVEHIEATPAELDAAAARLQKRRASDREALPASWARDWEEAHE